MATGAANERALGALHAHVAAVFEKVLRRYEVRMDALDLVDDGALEDIQSEAFMELMDDSALPNPAMLAAITKFLKDNSIQFDTEEVAGLSAIETRLAERRKTRRSVTSLPGLKVVADG